tara:strand:+ start:401 stop:709 length:309 start_codon:yes stop_codon:yes gene_type:complete
MSIPERVKTKMKNAGLREVNKPQRLKDSTSKSHHVMARYREGNETKYKYIKFGDENAKTAGKPKKGESEATKKKRASFKARHAKNIAKGPSSAAYWANKVKW